jgi:hypothetical protein
MDLDRFESLEKETDRKHKKYGRILFLDHQRQEQESFYLDLTDMKKDVKDVVQYLRRGAQTMPSGRVRSTKGDVCDEFPEQSEVRRFFEKLPEWTKGRLPSYVLPTHQEIDDPKDKTQGKNKKRIRMLIQFQDSDLAFRHYHSFSDAISATKAAKTNRKRKRDQKSKIKLESSKV